MKAQTEKQNGPVQRGIPYGKFNVGDKLNAAFASQAKLESQLLTSREEIKSLCGKKYMAFKAKFPKAGLADFARQFNKDVPFSRDEYKRNATYLALDNMFRYMPEVKTGGKTETREAKAARIAKAVKERKAKQKAAHAKQSRYSRLLCALQAQLGIPNHLFAQACKIVGFVDADVESILNTKGGLIDLGLGPYVMAVRATGVSAAIATAKQAKAAQASATPVPTRKVTDVPKVGPQRERVNMGKGRMKTVVIQASDNLSAPTPTATA